MKRVFYLYFFFSLTVYFYIHFCRYFVGNGTSEHPINYQ